MKLVLAAFATFLVVSTSYSAAYVPAVAFGVRRVIMKPLHGYLDDLSDELRAPSGDPDLDSEDKVLTNLAEDKKDRFGVGDWSSYVDFGDEFDGGDGQMGVAGDGKKGLEKDWDGDKTVVTKREDKSKLRSAKVAWGKSTGYADELRAKGVETSRAQQLENWQNQNSLRQERVKSRYLTEEFDQVSIDENWRDLGKFQGERLTDTDLDKVFGPVTNGDKVVTTIQLSSRTNQNAVFDFGLVNSFMGYSEFRAAFTPDTNAKEWKVSPTEGSLSGKKETEFVVKFRPSGPTVSTGYLVIDTEDDKWTFRLEGTGSM